MIALVILTAVYVPIIALLLFRTSMAREYGDTLTIVADLVVAVWMSLLLSYAWWTR